jgi:hypothetical protein
MTEVNASLRVITSGEFYKRAGNRIAENCLKRRGVKPADRQGHVTAPEKRHLYNIRTTGLNKTNGSTSQRLFNEEPQRTLKKHS